MLFKFPHHLFAFPSFDVQLRVIIKILAFSMNLPPSLFLHGWQSSNLYKLFHMLAQAFIGRLDIAGENHMSCQLGIPLISLSQISYGHDYLINLFSSILLGFPFF